MYYLMNSMGTRYPAMRSVLFMLAVKWARVRYWAWSGILDARRIAWRGDTAQTEHNLGLTTMIVGLWWAAMPQPLWSVFGALTNAIFAGLVPVLALLFAASGRNMLHQLVQGSARGRCRASRFVFIAWAFVLFNQLLLRWDSVGTILFAFMCWHAAGIHARCANGRKPEAGAVKIREERRTAPRAQNKEAEDRPGGDNGRAV